MSIAPRTIGPGPDDRLSLVVDRPDGTQVRWADDEPDVGNVPTDLTFGTSMPGGFKGLTCQLMRGIRGVGREGLFDDVRVLGPGGATRWEGRLQQLPVSTDGGGRVSPQAVGWQAHLDDRQDAREIYVDRTHDRWGPVTLERTQSLLNQNFKPHAGSTNYRQESGAGAGPALDLRVPGYAWSSVAGRPACSLQYDSGGIPLGVVRGNFYSNIANDTGGFFVRVYSCDRDPTPGHVQLQRFTTNASPGAGVAVNIATTAQPNLLFEWYYNLSPAGSANSVYYAGLENVAVYGRHGLPIVDGGVLASDVLANALSRWAPRLRYTAGAGGSIQPTTLPIRHLVFAEHGGVSTIVDRVNAFHAWDWAVWEDRTFHFHERGEGGRAWRISTADGLDLSLEGETTDRIFTGVVVTYTDYAGVQRSVGPPGSGAEAINPLLATDDPANPAVAHGLSKVGVLQLSVPSDAVSAATIGQVWLRLQATATRRGQATVTGWVTDDAGQWRPVSEVRAGDTLVVTDRPQDPPRRIIETSHTYGPRTNTLTLDATAATLEAILEFLAADLVGVL